MAEKTPPPPEETEAPSRRRLLRVAAWWAPAVILAGVFAFLIPSTTSSAAPRLQAAGGPSSTKGHHPATDPALVYQENCASCHGNRAQGTARAPTLKGVGEAGVDFMLRTGLMPLKKRGPAMPTNKPYFSQQVIAALDKYVPALAGGGGPTTPKVNPGLGTIARGGTVFREYCAACHSWAGAGGVLVDRAIPNLFGATDRIIGDAVRFGPKPMPQFGTAAVSNSDLNSIVAYLNYMKHPYDRGGDPLSYVGPVASGFTALAIGLVILVGLIRWIGKRG